MICWDTSELSASMDRSCVRTQRAANCLSCPSDSRLSNCAFLRKEEVRCRNLKSMKIDGKMYCAVKVWESWLGTAGMFVMALLGGSACCRGLHNKPPPTSQRCLLPGTRKHQQSWILWIETLAFPLPQLGGLPTHPHPSTDAVVASHHRFLPALIVCLVTHRSESALKNPKNQQTKKPTNKQQQKQTSKTNHPKNPNFCVKPLKENKNVCL